MRLLKLENDGDFSLTDFVGKEIPQYAILSHTWRVDTEEPTYQDLVNGTGKSKAGYRKICFCGKQAAKDGLRYFWVDTACIDKSSSAELAESINSMYRWYQDATKCYVYLSDVSANIWKPAFTKSRWFTRGWTLQELIAPASVDFFSAEEELLGNKQSLEQILHEITGIPIKALRGSSMSDFTVKERMLWAATRETKREEDTVYSLLGIFDIHMPLIYGERREKALNRLNKKIKESSENIVPDGEREPSYEERRNAFLMSLEFDQIDARYMTISSAHTKTCAWLLQSPEYLDWLDASKVDDHRGFLWIKGKPGAGKSTLMKYVLANARETMRERIVISFFFNARGGYLEKSTMGTYQSLLLQLLKQIPTLFGSLEQIPTLFGPLGVLTSKLRTTYQWTVESLEAILREAIRSLGHFPVVCFIDALDECEERQIRSMISFFEGVSELAITTKVKFQICFSSRHYPHITMKRNLNLVLEGQEGHGQDMISYVDSELKIGDSKTAQQIRTELHEKASGVFMWVILVVGILNKEYDRGRIHVLQRRFQELPSDLHALFHDMLTRDSDNRDELVLCIQWILFSKEPLNPEQLYFAILSGVEPEAPSRWDSDEITTDVIKMFILSSSKGLAVITESKTQQKVQFIHESVKDFLLKENGLADIQPNLKTNFLGQGHECLKLCCLKYMSLEILAHKEFIEDLPNVLSPEIAVRRRSATCAFPFLEYAVHNVLYHADVAAGCSVAQENFVQTFPLASWVKLNNLFENFQARRYTEDVKLLYILAEGNRSNLIRGHPSILSWLQVGKERCGPPLFAALTTWSKDSVQRFLQAHLRDEPPDSRLQRLYSQYCQNGDRQTKFGRDFKFNNQRTILSYLAELGDRNLFAILLEVYKDDIESKDHTYGRTPLSWAAGSASGQEAIVKLLLDTGLVDVNSKDKNGRTPLSWAVVQYRQEAVVKLLLKTGRVDVDSEDNNGRTPLSWAAGNGKSREAVVKLLLQTNKVNVNSKDNHGRTPLAWASRNGQGAVVKLLLKTGKVDVSSKNNNG